MGLRAGYLDSDFQKRVVEIAKQRIDMMHDALAAVLAENPPPGRHHGTKEEVTMVMEEMAAEDPVRAAAILMNDEDVRKKVT